MRIEPRQQILDVWKAVARSSWVDGQWTWGGRHERNSISDAEQLMCLIGPATDIPTFKLDLPNETAEDAIEALEPIGDSVEVPRALVRVITEYLERYSDKDGTPLFSGGSYFSVDGSGEPSPKQLDLDVVDSFSVSIRLMLATIGFVKVFRTVVRRQELLDKINTLEEMASKRLSAAMVGLLRSFSVYVYDIGSPDGQTLIETINQEGRAVRSITEELQERLKDVKASLREVTVGSGSQVEGLDNDNKLFECGWSWGIVENAPDVDTNADVGHQRPGVAEDKPYLYFTVVALDCIQSLFSERTRVLGLLDDEQQRLSRSLQLRWDLTQLYWSRIARFGQGRWPLEDMPWRTTDAIASDYLSLLVSSIVVQDLARRRTPESDAIRVGNVLTELAGRARITRRPTEADPAILLHQPGFRLPLVGSVKAGDHELIWRLADFAPQLLKQTIQVAGLTRTVETREPLAVLTDQVWETHMVLRKLETGPGEKLWDEPSRLYQELKPGDGQPSWYFTERVVGCLITAADYVSSPPLRSPTLTEIASDLLAEADHLFDQELLTVSAEAGPAMGTTLHTVRTTLRRAREVIRERPGTAYVLAGSVLRELDRLAAARLKATGAG